MRSPFFVRILELNNLHEIERDDLAGIPSIGASIGAGMTEECERRIKAGTRLLFSASWKDAKERGEEEASSAGCFLQECLDPEPSAEKSLRDEEEKKSAKEPMPRSVIRVATLSVDFPWRSQKSRGSSSLPEEGRRRFNDVILWPWAPNKDGVNQKSIAIQGH